MQRFQEITLTGVCKRWMREIGVALLLNVGYSFTVISYTYLQQAKFTAVPQWRTCCFRYESNFQFFNWNEMGEKAKIRYSVNGERGKKAMDLLTAAGGSRNSCSQYPVYVLFQHTLALMNSHSIFMDSVTLWNSIWISLT